ncbi:hypothetical protein FA13DRAFT_1793808 [Coprinellus micaceus]|uniref:DUF6533 domain-containing protein n=1 Tax=Coprinellus micaceus TaxID=71717 RepID=A0A4Y7T3P9_COPMI|nr:hypothetical protein FA13DRAFT_1793808 [Coprinellus micaceus]
MSLSATQIQALADTVTIWRMQEYIYIAFYCFYVYYVLTTIDEEVSVILPQKWNRGKMLYMIIRHAEVLYIAVQLTAEYRNYFSIPLASCKVMLFMYKFLDLLVTTTCDFSLGLCLSALLQGRKLSVMVTLSLSCALPIVDAIFILVAIVQFRPEPIYGLPAELGYPCPYASPAQWAEQTIAYVGREIRGYLTLCTTILLFGLGALTLVVRYKGQGGRLLRVLRRDGGIHYMSLLVLRLLNAIVYTPAVISMPNLDSNPVFHFLNAATDVVIPILAQRLLINMRKIDYMGSQPIASKLLFAPPGPGTDEYEENPPKSFASYRESSNFSKKGATSCA